MDKRNKPGAESWKGLFQTIARLKLPWGWIAAGMALNLWLNDIMLELPNTTANLLGGDLSAGALAEAVWYYVLFGIVTVMAVVGQVQAQSYGVKRARDSVWKKMLGMKMEYYDRNDPSDLMSSITNDTNNAVQSFVNVLIVLIPALYYVIAAMFRINEYHWVLFVSCFALVPIKYLYAFILGRTFQKANARLYGTIGTLTSFLADRINHLLLIKSYTNENAENKSGHDTAYGLYKAQMKLVHIDNITIGAASVIDILQKFAVVVVAVILLQRGEIDIAMWLAFFLFSQNLFPMIDSIFDCWIRIKAMQGAFQRVTDIMTQDSEDSADGAEEFTGGEICFENVTFTYPETDEPALKNVSFTIPEGTSAAIVGMCGSGKTTSVSLLERFYVPDEGKVYVGGTDINDLALASFRRGIAYVQQGTEIFSGTLREALTYGIDREVSENEIFAAAEKTGFDEYLKLCTDGLETEVAAGGQSMSGGQSQRLVLTRELLRGGNIIIMDEPTSALDVRVSEKIQETMDAVFAGKTRLVITHDLTFARNYDKIVVLSGGSLVGEGRHEELLESCAVYREMVENAREVEA